MPKITWGYGIIDKANDYAYCGSFNVGRVVQKSDDGDNFGYFYTVDCYLPGHGIVGNTTGMVFSTRNTAKAYIEEIVRKWFKEAGANER